MFTDQPVLCIFYHPSDILSASSQRGSDLETTNRKIFTPWKPSVPGRALAHLQPCDGTGVLLHTGVVDGTGVLLHMGVVGWGQRDSRSGSSHLGVTAKYLKVGDLARNS